MKKFKIEIIGRPDSEQKIVKASSMTPFQIGIIKDKDTTKKYKDDIVMRTASIDKFELLSLSKAANDNCWTDKKCPFKISILPKGTKLLIEIL